MKKTILAIILVFIMIISFVLFQNKDNSLLDIQEANTIRIGYAIEAPYAYLKPNGEITGLDILNAKEITNRLGIKNIEWRLMEFGSLINELESDKIDIIAAGMYITPERAKRINFSEPTFHSKQGLMVIKGNPKKLFSYEQAITVKDAKIAVLKGSIYETLLREIGYNNSRLVFVPDNESGKIAVETGLADGFALTQLSLRWIIIKENKGKVEMATPFKQPNVPICEKIGYGAVEFQKKDIQLQRAWNKELKLFIGSPKHLKMLREFGLTKDELPGEISTEKILN